nr:hypothetical protein EP46_14065 [Pantoea sp. 3.5.1]
MVATGVATGATLMAPVRAYADSENAATQLAASMMGPGAKVLPEYEKNQQAGSEPGRQAARHHGGLSET